MPPAADLTQAGKQSWDRLATLSIAGTLRTKLLSFCGTIQPLFPTTLTEGHPTANWIAVLYAFSTNMSSTALEWPVLRIAADYLYRLCLMTNQLTTALPTQTTAVLAAYNANF